MKKIILFAAMFLVSFTGFAQPKFAHVKFSELVQLMPEAYDARKTISESSNEAQETYQSMLEEFNTKYQEYQQKAATWSDVTRQSKEKTLTDLQQRIQEFEQSVQTELQEQQQKLMAPIYQKAQETVNTLAKEGGYIYVFDITAALYVDDTQSDDLTPAARKALGITDDKTMESLQEELQAQAQAQQDGTAGSAAE